MAWMSRGSRDTRCWQMHSSCDFIDFMAQGDWVRGGGYFFVEGEVGWGQKGTVGEGRGAGCQGRGVFCLGAHGLEGRCEHCLGQQIYCFIYWLRAQNGRPSTHQQLSFLSSNLKQSIILVCKMSYQKAMQILKNGLNEQGFEYFLSLTEQQLNDLCQYLSQQDQKLILTYIQKRQHTPSKSTRPDFAESVKSVHSKIKFSEIESLKKQDEGESLQTLMRRSKSELNENVFNYPFYGVIKRMMCALLDVEPDTETVKMMHSQLQSLFKQLLSEKLLNGLADTLSIKQHSYLHQKAKKPLDVKSFRRYLSEIFTKEYKSFKRFMKKGAKATAGIEEEDLKAIEKIQEESEQQPVEEELQSDDPDDEEKQYFLRKTEKMTEEEFSQYADNRSLNFMVFGSDKLMRFVDSRGAVIPKFKSKELLKLISYVLCRSLRQIVFRILAANNKGILQPLTNTSVTHDQVQRIGNDYVDRIRKRAKTYSLKLPTFLQKAQQLFISEFQQYGYDKLLSNQTKFKLTKDKEGKVEAKDQAEMIWRRNKGCRRKWFERVEAESQYEAYRMRGGVPRKYVNRYAELLFGGKERVSELGFGGVFREYFTSQNTQPTTQPNIDDIANLRMESLLQ